MIIPVEVFLSHADEDRKIARKLANKVQAFDFKVFVAHDDIDAGDNWEEILVEKITDCDIFLVLLSENYHKAHYTDHEVGIARGLNKPIIPVRIDSTEPYGFLSKTQARKITSDNEDSEIGKLVDKMTSLTEKGKNAIDKLIKEFGEAGTFKEANSISNALFGYTKFSKEQINDLAEAYLDNSQIRGGFRASPRCEDLFRENWKKLDRSTQRKLEVLWEENG
jgi:hypothetical protein